MSQTAGFYLAGCKGLHVLSEFVGRVGASSVCFVVAGRDSGVARDFFDEIHTFSDKHNLHFFGRDDLENFNPPVADLDFAIGWRWMLPSDQNLVILHDSLLPKYRGFAPLVNALVAGEKTIGVTALRGEKNYDSGAIFSQKSAEISYPIKIAAAIERVMPLYADLVVSVYTEFVKSGKLTAREQDEAQASYSPWRDESDYLIPWSESSAYIKRFCDAVGNPYKGAMTYWGRKAIRVIEVRELADIEIADRSKHIGKVMYKKSGHPAVVCGSGLLQITDARFEDTAGSIFEELPLRVRFSEASQ